MTVEISHRFKHLTLFLFKAVFGEAFNIKFGQESGKKKKHLHEKSVSVSSSIVARERLELSTS